MATNGSLLRGDSAWIARAATPLPVPDLAGEQHRRVGARAPLRRCAASASLIDADSPSSPENFAASSATIAAVVSVSTRVRAISLGVDDALDDRRQLGRLGDVVVGAAPHRLDRVLDGAERRHHQHRRRRPQRADRRDRDRARCRRAACSRGRRGRSDSSWPARARRRTCRRRRRARRAARAAASATPRRSPRHRRSACEIPTPGPPLLPYRQLDDNARAAAAPIEQPNAPMMLVDDLLGHRQPEPGAARLRREERIEYAPAHLIGDARPAIGHRQDQLRCPRLPIAVDRRLRAPPRRR